MRSRLDLYPGYDVLAKRDGVTDADDATAADAGDGEDRPVDDAARDSVHADAADEARLGRRRG